MIRRSHHGRSGLLPGDSKEIGEVKKNNGKVVLSFEIP